MNRLAPDLFDRRFAQLVELARSQLPALAPEWTDHNAHDPGITLIELLAWVAEAQMYSLARTRTDERAAYAALLGLLPGGTQPARGLVWPDAGDPLSPAATFSGSVVIPANTTVRPLGSDEPVFQCLYPMLWMPGTLRRLSATLADGSLRDFTSINARDEGAYLPFGETAGPRDVLSLAFECRSDQGLFPPHRDEARGARLIIGVRADAAQINATADAPDSVDAVQAPTLEITLVGDAGRFALEVIDDTSAGLMQTGALVLGLDAVVGSPQRFSIEILAPRGFARPPRLLRLQPNVLPIVQGQRIEAERHEAKGQIDQSLELGDSHPLSFAPGQEPVQIQVQDGAGVTSWRRALLAEAGPQDEVFELDVARRRITFGNGINGRIPTEGAIISARYAVCDGPDGGVARNRRWRLPPFPGAFGINLDPVVGGTAGSTLSGQRRDARRRWRTERSIVSAGDLCDAALALPLLEVARAWVVAPSDALPRTNSVRLVAMRARTSRNDVPAVPEPPRWLGAIRRALVGRMMLATRLQVVAPAYVPYRLDATLVAQQGRDPMTVKSSVFEMLAQRTALIANGPSVTPRVPGVPIALREVVAWMRAVDGVQGVADLRILLADGRRTDEVAVPRGGLPSYDAAGSTITILRSGNGGAL